MNNGKIRQFVHGGDIYSADSPLGYWLDFSANINPLGVPEAVKAAIINSMEDIIHYPDPQGRALKEAIAAHYGVNKESVVLGNGAAELFYVYFHTKRPQRVILPVPSFSEYERSARAAGAEVDYYYLAEEDGFTLDLERFRDYLAKEIVQGEKATVVLGNPNNPTGGLLLRENLQKFIAWAADEDIDVIIDESFLDFRQDRSLCSVCDLPCRYTNLLVVSSMTKAFAIPGLRLGFGLAHPDKVEGLEFNKDTWNVNSLAQAAGIAALSDYAYQAETLQNTQKTVAWLYEKLQRIAGITVYEPTVNFVLLNIKATGFNSMALVKSMKAKGILVRDCSNYPGLSDYFVRVAVRSIKENQLLVQALKECLGELI